MKQDNPEKLTASNLHIPVLLKELADAISPLSGASVVDCTFGCGGYTENFLKAGASVIAFDRDADAKLRAEKLLSVYPEKFRFFHTKFSQLSEHIAPASADAVIFDVGVSSPQLDNGERGFSFMRPGPLDMRMGLSEKTAADIVNETPETALANLLYEFGDETRSRKIASEICLRRKVAPFLRSEDLAEFIKKITPSRDRKIHPATKTFQALRIAVNNELDELKIALSQAIVALKSGGKLAVVSFHSLEDGIVKSFFKELISEEKFSKYAPKPAGYVDAPFKAIFKKPIVPARAEIIGNPRSRSAKMRVICKK